MAAAAPVMHDVVEEHLDEAAFLWSQWTRALTSPGMTLEKVAAGPEERLLAHLEGLAVAGAAPVLDLLAGDVEDEGPHHRCPRPCGCACARPGIK